jgi:signal transduction histidine kinase
MSEQSLNISGEELTERFVRGDVSRNTEGSGLGLSIAQSLMKLQNGNLDVIIDGDLFKIILTLDEAVYI